MPRSKPSKPKRRAPTVHNDGESGVSSEPGPCSAPAEAAGSSQTGAPAFGGSLMFEVPASMVIRVRHADGMRRIEMEGLHTVGGLKRRIMEELGTPMSRQVLTLPPPGSESLSKDSATLASAGLKHGSIVTLSTQPPKKRARSSSSNSRGDAKGSRGGSKPARKKSRKSKETEPDVFEREGETGAEIALAFRTSGSAAAGGLMGAGERIYSQTRREYRLKAAQAKKVKIMELLEASRFSSTAVSRGRKYLVVEFTAGRKKVKEVVALYEAPLVESVVSALVKTHTSAARTTMQSSLHAMDVEKLAERSPPLFWSVYYMFPQKSMRAAIQILVREAFTKYQSERSGSAPAGTAKD